MKIDENKKKLNQIIESIVKNVLLEQDIVAEDPLVKIFIQPFTNVIKVANAELQKTLTRAKINTKSIAKQLGILLIPFISGKMIEETHENAQKELKTRLGAIDKKYADVYQQVWDNVRNRDVWGITFMLNPAMGIASKFMMKAPLTTINLLETLTAGGLSPANQQRLEQAKELATKLSRPISPNAGGSGGGGGGAGGGYGGGLGEFDGGEDGGGAYGGGGMGESITYIVEQNDEEAGRKNSIKKLVNFVEKFKQLPEVNQAIQGSSIAISLRQGALDAVTKSMQPILSATTFDQVKSILGSDASKIESDLLKRLPENATEEEILQIKQEALPEIKNAYKQVMITQLSQQSTGNSLADKSLGELINQIKNS